MFALKNGKGALFNDFLFALVSVLAFVIASSHIYMVSELLCL